jgi:hypothetical protein
MYSEEAQVLLAARDKAVWCLGEPTGFIKACILKGVKPLGTGAAPLKEF